MEKPPVFSLDVLADQSLVKDIVRGILSTIFFHRFFPPVKPTTTDLLDLTLPSVDDAELDIQIEERTASLVREIETSSSMNAGGNSNASTGQIAVQFFERRRRKAWFSSNAEEEVCWEQWIVNVTIIKPRTDSERARVRKTMETKLQQAVLQIITNTTCYREHIPPIMTTEKNPFPYQIVVQQKGDTWTGRMGIF